MGLSLCRRGAGELRFLCSSRWSWDPQPAELGAGKKEKRDAYTWCAHRRSRVWPTEAAGTRLLHLQICIISVTHWQSWVLTGRRRIKARINTLNRIIWVCIQQALQSNYFFLKEWSFFKSLEQGSSMRGCAPFDPNWSVAVIRISLISLGAVEESALGSG